jgi:isoquinoline 1-oxidoreductase beta subunit
MSAFRKLDRREFLALTGTASAGVLLLGLDTRTAQAAGTEAVRADFQPNLFVGIDSDGTISLLVHRSEMGQGTRTACAMLMAEELHVGLDQVTIVQAIGHPRYGDQNTDGSRSIRFNYTRLRQMGAAAREMLESAAAEAWDVPVSDLVVRNGSIRHDASNRAASYGAFASAAAALPVPEDPVLKDRADFDLIRTAQPMIDMKAITTGHAVYGMDVEVEGMVYASLERSPTVGGRVASFDAAAARAVPGVTDVVELPADESGLTNHAVVVLATNTWAAMEGRRRLSVEWQAPTGDLETTESFTDALRRSTEEAPNTILDQGDIDTAFDDADQVLEARFQGPHLAHAPMEPMCLTAHVQADGCEVWAPTQEPQWARREAARVTGLEEDAVIVNVTMLGGGFGRKSKPDQIIEVVALSKQIGRPVQIAWTREDEVRHGFYRAQNYQIIRAALKDGAVTGWHHAATFPTIGSTFNPQNSAVGRGDMGQGATNLPYRIPNIRVSGGDVGSDLRIGWLRSVNHTFITFATQSAMDELAHELGRDPIEFQLEMLGAQRYIEPFGAREDNPYRFDTDRLKAVVERVRDESGWGRTLPEGHGLGFACQYSFASYVASVVHASVENGRARAHEVWTVIDPGSYVNSDTVKQQLEGSAVFALSYVLHGRITTEDGVVQQSNFHDYPLARMNESPLVNAFIMENDHPPAGVGEPGVPPFAPAFTNAVFAASGVRVRDLPIGGRRLE